MFRRLRRFWQLRGWLGWALAFEQTEQEMLFDGLQETLKREATHREDRPLPTSRVSIVTRAL